MQGKSLPSMRTAYSGRYVEKIAIYMFQHVLTLLVYYPLHSDPLHGTCHIIGYRHNRNIDFAGARLC